MSQKDTGGEVIQFTSIPQRPKARQRAYRPTTWRGVIVADVFRAIGGARAAQAAMQSAAILDRVPRGQGVNERCAWRGLLICVWFARVEIVMLGQEEAAGLHLRHQVREVVQPTEAYGIRFHLHERLRTLVITRPRALRPITSLLPGGGSRRRKVA